MKQVYFTFPKCPLSYCLCINKFLLSVPFLYSILECRNQKTLISSYFPLNNLIEYVESYVSLYLLILQPHQRSKNTQSNYSILNILLYFTCIFLGLFSCIYKFLLLILFNLGIKIYLVRLRKY